MEIKQDNFMGNGKHLKVLLEAIEKEDISIWNSFVVKQGSQFRPDLRGLILEAENLSGYQFKLARLNEAVFKACDLSKVNLEKAEIANAVFNSCNMSGAKFTGCDIKTAVFEDSDMRGAILGRKVKVKSVQAAEDYSSLDRNSPEWKKMRQIELQKSAVKYNKEMEEKEKKRKKEEAEHKARKARRDSPIFRLKDE